MSHESEKQTTSIASKHPDYLQFQDEYRLIRSLMDGTQAMRDAGELYLPKKTEEGNKHYATRLKASFLNPGFSDAIEKQTAKPFSRPINVENSDSMTGVMDGYINDIDGRGTDITGLGKSSFASGASFKSVFLFTDFTQLNLPPGASKADEASAAGRPHTFFISDADVFNWHFGDDGKYDEFRYLSSQLVQDGKFGYKKQNVIFRWFRDKWEKYVEHDKENEHYEELSGSKFWELVESREHGFDGIPVEEVVFRDGKTSNSELAEACLEYYQMQSDLKNIVTFIQTGVWFARGVGKDEMPKFTIGANSLITLEDTEADLSVVEHTGTAAQVGRRECDIVADRIEALSCKPMIQRSSGDVTAAEVNTNSASACSGIRSWGISLQKGLERSIANAYKWIKTPMPSDIKVVIYDDYVIEGVSTDFVGLIDMYREGAISKELLINECIRRGILDTRTDVKAELKKSDDDLIKKLEIENDAKANEDVNDVTGDDGNDELQDN